MSNTDGPNHFGAKKRALTQRRWVPYLLLACLMTFAARVPHTMRWHLAEYLDTFAIDGCFEQRGPLSANLIANELYPTKEFLLIELPYNTPLPLLTRLVRMTKTAKVVAIDLMLVDKRTQLKPAELPLYRAELPHWQQENSDLARAISSSGNVILGAWPEIKRYPVPGAPVLKTMARQIWERPSPALWKAARWHAHLLMGPSTEDGITRTSPLFQSTLTDPSAQPIRLPSLSLAVTGAVEGLSQKQLAGLHINNEDLALGSRHIAVPDNGELPIDFLGGRECFDGDQIHWNYSYVLLQEDALDAAQDFAGKIVFMGRTDYKAKDDFTTPFGDMPGVHVHMHAAATLLSRRGPPIPLTLWQTTLIALCCSILLVFPLLRLSLWGSLLAALLLCVLVMLGCFELFLVRHRFFSTSVPIFAIALTYNAVALYEYGRARTALARFVGSDVATAMLSPLRDLSLGGQTQSATAFFCDLRRFSSVAEKLSPDVVESLVNAYTSKVSKVTARFDGRVIDYYGDGVFVLFRQPGGEHALKALEAALELQRETHDMMAEWYRLSGVNVKIGIGINSGEMAIGVVGSQDHMKLGAVGDAVNVASRVQGLSERCGYGILVTKESYDLIAGRIALDPCGHFAVKGREQEVQVFGAGIKSNPNPTPDAPQTDFAAATAQNAADNGLTGAST